jgi:hypothetical protein
MAGGEASRESYSTATQREASVSYMESTDSAEEQMSYPFLIHSLSDLTQPSPNLVAFDEPGVTFIKRFKRLDKFSFRIEFEEVFPHHRQELHEVDALILVSRV